MAKKHLLVEVVADLTEVARGHDQSALTDDELGLVKTGLARGSYYAGGVRSDPAVLMTLNDLQKGSPAMTEVAPTFKTGHRLKGPWLCATN